MSFSVNFGSGIHGTPTTFDTTPINSYARITALTPNSATINLQAASTGTFGKFETGNEILQTGSICLTLLTCRLSKHALNLVNTSTLMNSFVIVAGRAQIRLTRN